MGATGRAVEQGVPEDGLAGIWRSPPEKHFKSILGLREGTVRVMYKVGEVVLRLVPLR